MIRYKLSVSPIRRRFDSFEGRCRNSGNRVTEMLEDDRKLKLFRVSAYPQAQPEVGLNVECRML